MVGTHLCRTLVTNSCPSDGRSTTCLSSTLVCTMKIGIWIPIWLKNLEVTWGWPTSLLDTTLSLTSVGYGSVDSSMMDLSTILWWLSTYLREHVSGPSH